MTYRTLPEESAVRVCWLRPGDTMCVCAGCFDKEYKRGDYIFDDTLKITDVTFKKKKPYIYEITRIGW